MRVEFIQEFRAEDYKNQLIAQTWNAWLLGAAPQKTFNWTLVHYGLKEKEKPLTPEQRKQKAQEAYSLAEKIALMDRGVNSGRKRNISLSR